MIVRVIIQNQYKEELHNNEWFADMGDWRNAEGYASTKLFGFWRKKYEYGTILMSELLDNSINNDDNLYEISDVEWYLLKDDIKEQFVDNRNIVISNSAEAFLYGLSKSDKYDLNDYTIPLNPNYFDKSELAKKFIVVWDNINKTVPSLYPHIHFINTDFFLLEAISHLDAVTSRWTKTENGKVLETSLTKINPVEEYAPWIKKLPNFAYGYDKFIELNLSNLLAKQHNFVCLFGFEKPHRRDLFDKMIENNLVERNVVGSYDKRYPNTLYEPTESMVRDGIRGLNDRMIAPQWIQNCKVWISNETWWEGTGAHLGHITEKTYKPIQYGMPFLVNGAHGTLEYLEDLGFKSYRDIFGDYIVKDDLEKTNDNIINIIENLHPYIKDNVDYITKCAVHNWHRLEQMTIEQRLQQVENKIWN
tara:strand:- start:45302 stop:46558 length:1257 start_codon:yes stop_codon:yes gene_type:complete